MYQKLIVGPHGLHFTYKRYEDSKEAGNVKDEDDALDQR